jgi:hypothetical protein
MRRSKFIGETRAEKTAARKLARAQCAAERTRFHHWIPEERARVKKQIAVARADLVTHIARLKQKLIADIAAGRARVHARTCVDLTGGPITRRFGPRKPQALAALRSRRGLLATGVNPAWAPPGYYAHEGTAAAAEYEHAVEFERVQRALQASAPPSWHPPGARTPAQLGPMAPSKPRARKRGYSTIPPGRHSSAPPPPRKKRPKA